MEHTVRDDLPTSCPNCHGNELYTRRVSTGPHFYALRDLGHFMHYAHIDVVLCRSCGHMMLFAEPDAYNKVHTVHEWQRIRPKNNES